MEFGKIEKLNKFKSRILDEHKKSFFKDSKYLKNNIINDLNKWFIQISSENKRNKADNESYDSIDKYKKVINEKYKRLPMVGFDRVFDMEGIYIPLTVHSKNDSFVKCKTDRNSCDNKIFEKAFEAKDLIEIECDDNAFVVLADPGMGKTTMLKYITYFTSKENEKYIPVFVKLADFCNEDMILEEYLLKTVRELGVDFDLKVKKLINSGKVVVLLDGLDEVKRIKYSDVTNKICNFVAGHKNCRVIITSRINGFKNDKLPFPIFEIDKLPIEEIKIFIDKWFVVDNGLLNRIKANKRILELAHNPFILSIICLIFEKENILPNRRVELYKKCVNTLLNLRNGEDIPNKNIFSSVVKEKVLINIAYENFIKGNNEFAYNSLYDSISKTIKELSFNDNCEDSILSEICENSGILHKGDDSYIFLHRTFFEYYVSLKMAELNKNEIIKFVNISKFEEPLRLFAGQISSVIEGTEFIKNVWDKDKPLAIRCFPDMDKVIDAELIKKMLSEAGVDERIKLVKELHKKLDDEEKIVDTLRGLFKHETNGEVLYWGVQILEKSSVPGAVNIVKEKLDNGAKERFEKYVRKFMVEIPEGEFMMGSEKGDDREKPVHKVKLAGYYMSKYPVTNKLYEKFDPEHRKRWGKKSDDDNQPVIYVNWYEAIIFARWLGCELPTEAQWEYACRAETTTEYNTGNELTTEQANFGFEIRKITPVNKYKPNKWGLYDMHGNVWEWCKDWYDKDYYSKCDSESIVGNPENVEEDTYRVLRGGSWNRISWFCRSAYRSRDTPGRRFDDIGFRLFCSSV